MLSECIHSLEKRHIAGAGFAGRPGGNPRSDATCWAILALRAAGGRDSMVKDARQALAAAQLPDGRVCVTPQHRDAFWPTAVAILAWHRTSEYKLRQEKAATFLLRFDQMRIADNPSDVIGHDPTIRGWPWIAGTSAWLEPTAYCLMALRLAGFEGHERTEEARRLIIDRQLARGGWNYGNTTVYGQELRPMPETTGTALEAIGGLVSHEEVAQSISYLRSQLPHLSTPLAVAWTLLGLAAWKEADEYRDSIARMATRREDYASWDTVSLSLLLLAWRCEEGLLDWLRQSAEETSS